jgi:uncharacterized protein involved in response to NO
MTPMLALALLLAMVGGRVVPALLRARKEGIGTGTPRPGRLAPADLPLIAAFALQLAGAGTGVTGACLILAGMAQGLRMAAWRLAALGMANASDLMLLVIAWLFLPAGLVLAGVALATGQAPGPGLHAIGMGAMGGLVLAIQSRALMERLPGALRPGGALIASFALVEAAALLRVILEPGPVTLPFTAGLWSLGWLTTAAAFLFAAARPLPHPVLSARRPRR